MPNTDMQTIGMPNALRKPLECQMRWALGKLLIAIGNECIEIFFGTFQWNRMLVPIISSNPTIYQCSLVSLTGLGCLTPGDFNFEFWIMMTLHAHSPQLIWNRCCFEQTKVNTVTCSIFGWIFKNMHEMHRRSTVYCVRCLFSELHRK